MSRYKKTRRINRKHKLSYRNCSVFPRIQLDNRHCKFHQYDYKLNCSNNFPNKALYNCFHKNQLNSLKIKMMIIKNKISLIKRNKDTEFKTEGLKSSKKSSLD